MQWVILVSLIALALILSDGDSVVPVEGKVHAIAEGIARAEGFYVDGSLPQRMNNPGALKLPPDSNEIAEFATPEQGWEALYHQIRLILTNRSGVYHSGMSIYEVALRWTGGDNPLGWARTVAQRLNTDIHAAIAYA